ncbi:MAG: CinA family protein [Pseudomonadota bacterium]
MRITERILAAAVPAGIVISTAESCTGGMLAAALTDELGSSAMFDRGFVTYTNAAKTELLGVSPATLERVGAVSEEVARDMATGALERSDATLALSITGIAGPGGSEHKPEGRVCFALATPAGVTARTVEFGALGRANVRLASRDHALSMILDQISRAA